MACYETKLTISNINSNPPGLKSWSAYPFAGIPNHSTWKIPQQLPAHEQPMSPINLLMQLTIQF